MVITRDTPGWALQSFEGSRYHASPPERNPPHYVRVVGRIETVPSPWLPSYLLSQPQEYFPGASAQSPPLPRYSLPTADQARSFSCWNPPSEPLVGAETPPAKPHERLQRSADPSDTR